MAKKSKLSRKLKAARKRRKWTIYQASQEMGDVHAHTLTTLEGDNPKRETDGSHTQLRTVIAVMAVYWPDIALGDFMESEFELVLGEE